MSKHITITFVFMLLLIGCNFVDSNYGRRDGQQVLLSCGRTLLLNDRVEEFSGRIAELNPEHVIESCGCEGAMIKLVSDSTYQKCMSEYRDMSECEKNQRLKQNTFKIDPGKPMPTIDLNRLMRPTDGFQPMDLVFTTPEKIEKFQKAGLKIGSSIKFTAYQIRKIEIMPMSGIGLGDRSVYWWIEDFEPNALIVPVGYRQINNYKSIK